MLILMNTGDLFIVKYGTENSGALARQKTNKFAFALDLSVSLLVLLTQ